ncbi:MAG: hypothetical protein IT162_15390 [Bryobacterales bacterium]|nr:hypothetical protein [Bryobacterales bacterium]
MDQADVPAFLMRAAAWAVAAVAGTLVLAWLAGALCRRAGLKGAIPALATLLTPIALLLGASLFFDAAGTVVDGMVQSKDEKVRMNSHSEFAHLWHRTLTLVVASSGGSVRTLVFAREEDFDAARVGAPVRVRLLPSLPWLGRLAHRNTWTALPWAWLAGAGLALAAGYAMWLAIRRYSHVLAPLGFIAAAWAWMIIATFPSPRDAGAAEGGEQTEAEVLAIHRVETTIGRLGLWSAEADQPWDIVELRLVPLGGNGEPVVAIDEVDAGSSPGLVNGARLPVRYRASLPREARLLHGTRHWRWREWENLLELHALVAALIAAMVAWAKFKRRT